MNGNPRTGLLSTAFSRNKDTAAFVQRQLADFPFILVQHARIRDVLDFQNAYALSKLVNILRCTCGVVIELADEDAEAAESRTTDLGLLGDAELIYCPTSRHCCRVTATMRVGPGPGCGEGGGVVEEAAAPFRGSGRRGTLSRAPTAGCNRSEAPERPVCAGLQSLNSSCACLNIVCRVLMSVRVFHRRVVG